MKILRTFPGLLIAAVLIPLFAIIPLIFTSVLLFMENSVKTQFIDNARNTASLLASNISQFDSTSDYDTINTLLNEYLFTGHISFAEIEWDSGATIHTNKDPHNEEHHNEDFFFGQHGDHTYYITMPFSGKTPKHSGTITLGFDENVVEEQLSTILQRTYYSALGLIIISTLSVLFAAGFLTRPLRRIRDTAKKISFQKEDGVLDTNSSIAELNSLGKSLENMRLAFIEQHSQIQSREKYISSIMRNMADPLVITNGKFQLQTLNNAARELFQFEKKDYRGRGLDTIFEPELIEKIQTHKGDESTLNLEGDGHKKNKDIIPLELNISHTNYDTSELYIINARDIRVRKEAELALVEAKQHAEDANKQKSYFLSTMSHELRTPMNAIIGYSDLVLEDLNESDENRKDILRIKRAATHLLDLINSILDLSKIEAGKMELHITHFSINDLMDEVVTTTQQLAKKNNNKLTIESELNNETLNSDYLKLKQIVINVVSNAAKFTTDGDIKIDIYGKEQEGDKFLCIDVTDTGIGIPDDKLKTLFDSFTQADSSVTRKYGGTGLGLAISKRLADMLEGDIEVDSQPGKGTKFHIYVSTELGDSTSVFI